MPFTENIAAIIILLFFAGYGIFFIRKSKKTSVLFKKVSKKDIKKASEFFEISVIRENDSDLKSALSYLNKAVALNPAQFEYYMYRGALNKKLARFHEAIADFTLAISINPAISEAFEQRKLIYIELEEFRNALHDAQAIVNLEPNNPLRYLQYADIQLAMNEKTGVVRYLNKAFELASEQNNIRLYKEISEKLKRVG